MEEDSREVINLVVKETLKDAFNAADNKLEDLIRGFKRIKVN